MKFHLIIHKLTDTDMEETKTKINFIENYLSSNPWTGIIDPISSIRTITSRARACDCLGQILEAFPASKRPFHQPPYCVLNNRNELRAQLDKHQLKYPVICKPIDACGTPSSHLMVCTLPTCNIYLTILC